MNEIEPIRPENVLIDADSQHEVYHQYGKLAYRFGYVVPFTSCLKDGKIHTCLEITDPNNPVVGYR